MSSNVSKAGSRVSEMNFPSRRPKPRPRLTTTCPRGNPLYNMATTDASRSIVARIFSRWFVLWLQGRAKSRFVQGVPSHPRSFTMSPSSIDQIGIQPARHLHHPPGTSASCDAFQQAFPIKELLPIRAVSSRSSGSTLTK